MRTLLCLVLLATVRLCWAAGDTANYPAYELDKVDTPIDLSEYTLIWSDEFDLLNASRPGRGSGHWFTGGHAVLASGEKMAHVPDPAYSIVSGVLQMVTRTDPVDSKRVEAHLQTNDGKATSVSFQDGYLETRMWVPAARGSHAGLWLLSEEKGGGHVEIDVVETYGTGDPSVHAATHVWPIRPLVHRSNSKRVVKQDIFAGFHLYGVLATDSHFIFYYDRKEICRIARLLEQRVPMYLLLSVFGNPTQPLIEPATMQVDYVRIYAPKRTPRPPVVYEPQPPATR
ncbi:MAG: family 16 glycosylhydrolase [Steroidobacteraceae bacterium]